MPTWTGWWRCTRTAGEAWRDYAEPGKKIGAADAVQLAAAARLGSDHLMTDDGGVSARADGRRPGGGWYRNRLAADAIQRRLELDHGRAVAAECQQSP
jgi:hypothetical protein